MDIPTNFTIGSTESIRGSKQKTNAELNSEDFLKIMAASISNPPISSGEGGGSNDGGSGDYISQIVQFNMVDQLTALTETVTTNMLMMQQQHLFFFFFKEVKVLDPKGTYQGVALGINDKGELLVRRADGMVEEVYAGEVSVRGLWGYV